MLLNDDIVGDSSAQHSYANNIVLKKKLAGHRGPQGEDSGATLIVHTDIH